jgi:hypothetical protein
MLPDCGGHPRGMTGDRTIWPRMVRPKPKRLSLFRGCRRPYIEGHKQFRAIKHKEALMLTLCIRYTIDANKLADFEAYARALPQPVERCGGKFVAFYLPTKIAGPTNSACGLIDFPDLASYQRYREQLMADADGSESLRRVEAAGCILNEERSFVRRIPE